MYRTIDASFWTDKKRIAILPPEGKLLAAYLITNPHSHVSGIYILPRLYIQNETGIPDTVLDTLCDTLSSLGFAHFDDDNDVVWVVNMLSYQGTGDKNFRSAANQLTSLHKSPLINDFLDRYPKILTYLGDRVSDTVSDRVSRSGTPNRNRNRTEQKGTYSGGPSEPRKTTGRQKDPAADAFAEAYHVNKGNPYGWQSGDFPQLAKLRKRLQLSRPDVPDCWDTAILNYFSSPLSEYSLQHFISKYDTFKDSAIDRFKVPVKIKTAGQVPKKQPEDPEHREKRCQNILCMMERDFKAGRRTSVPSIEEIRTAIESEQL